MKAIYDVRSFNSNFEYNLDNELGHTLNDTSVENISTVHAT
jgi:hypothetical protein